MTGLNASHELSKSKADDSRLSELGAELMEMADVCALIGRGRTLELGDGQLRAALSFSFRAEMYQLAEHLSAELLRRMNEDQRRAVA